MIKLFTIYQNKVYYRPIYFLAYKKVGKNFFILKIVEDSKKIIKISEKGEKSFLDFVKRSKYYNSIVREKIIEAIFEKKI